MNGQFIRGKDRLLLYLGGVFSRHFKIEARDVNFEKLNIVKIDVLLLL